MTCEMIPRFVHQEQLQTRTKQVLYERIYQSLLGTLIDNLTSNTFINLVRDDNFIVS